MMGDRDFLVDLMARPWALGRGSGLEPAGLYLGKGAHGIEVAVAQCDAAPARTALLETWEYRRGGRAAPVLLVVLHREGAALCGASGEEPPVYPRADVGQVERLCREVLAQPDRHSALRFLAQVLPSLETALPGLNNEGLLAMHELEHGAPGRRDWSDAGRKAARAVGTREEGLLTALGFQVERLDNLTSLLRGGDRRVALAVMLRETESPEAGTERFNSLSPVSYALAKADSENLSWVVLVQANRLRLYSTDVDAGVGRRGRTESFIECQPSLLSDQHLPYLWLLYSAEALAPDGSLRQILTESHRFAGSLAERLRERIYDRVVPALARGIAAARNLKSPSPAQLDHTYEMALTVLFRLLFIAYAEDRDLLPYRFNESYRRRSLKQKAQELAACVARAVPIAGGNSHWRETALLWEAVAGGNREWSVPAYDGGLFTSDPRVSAVGAELAGIVVPNEDFEAALPRSALAAKGSREFRPMFDESAQVDVDMSLNRGGWVFDEAFRDVSRATDSRTVRVALVPAEIFIANTGPISSGRGVTNRIMRTCSGFCRRSRSTGTRDAMWRRTSISSSSIRFRCPVPAVTTGCGGNSSTSSRPFMKAGTTRSGWLAGYRTFATGGHDDTCTSQT